MNQSNATNRYQNILNNLTQYLCDQEIESAKHCSEKFAQTLSKKKHIPLNTVLVAFGGGKDSSYMISYVRLIQMVIFIKYNHTFKMRVATNRHAGMPYAVMENIHRVYTALDMYNDPFVELLLIDGNKIINFNKDLPIPEVLRDRNRQDILMNGHRVNGDGRPTFCNACNLSMANSFAIASSYDKGVDAIITGDSRKEQRAYYVWVNRLAKDITGKEPETNNGFTSFLKNLDSISKNYFENIYGLSNINAVNERRINTNDINTDPIFFSVYEHTHYDVSKHWDLLVDFLKFEFDDLAFSFSETDCANPALMAHMRGLKIEHVYKRSYCEGIIEYLQLAIKLMREKMFPDHLILKNLYRYLDKDGMLQMRKKLESFAKDAFNLSTEQLICLIYSPFINKGKNLDNYIYNECTSLIPYLNRIHSLLKSSSFSTNHDHTLIAELTKHSGLSYNDLCVLYNDHHVNGSESIIKRILRDDPHKTKIYVQDTSSRALTTELISGR